MGRQFKDASAQNGCQAIHLLLEKNSGCQVHLNIHPSIHPFIHPSIRLSISLSLYRTPQIGGVGGTRALAHSILPTDSHCINSAQIWYLLPVSSGKCGRSSDIYIIYLVTSYRHEFWEACCQLASPDWYLEKRIVKDSKGGLSPGEDGSVEKFGAELATMLSRISMVTCVQCVGLFSNNNGNVIGI